MSLGPDVYGVGYEKGELVCRQGDLGDTMYIIQSGAVEVSRQNGTEEVVLAILEPGDFFGEMALLDQFPRSATVKTLSRTRLLPLTRFSFLQRVGEDPGVSFHVIKVLSQRIERTYRLLCQKICESLDELPGGADAAPGTSVPCQEGQSHEAARPATEPQAVVPGEIDAAELALAGGVAPGLPYAVFSGQESSCYEPGQVIYRQADSTPRMFLILEGSVEMREKRAGAETTIARLDPGNFLGEIALLTGLPHATTAVASDRTCLLPITIEQLLDYIRVNPELALYMVRSLILRLRHSLRAISDLEESAAEVRPSLPPLLKKKGQISLAVISLSSCGGCSAVLLDDQQELEKLLQRAKFTYCTMLMDQSALKEVDVALVDGVIRVKEDEEKLEEARQKSRFLVAWGTCSAFGGIPAMANAFELEELIEESYGETLDPLAYYLSGAKGVQRFIYQAREFGLRRRAYPAHHFVRVDYYLPGCPPNPALVTRLVGDLTGKAPAQEPRQIVCAECSRKPRKAHLESLEVFTRGPTEPDLCFLSLGIVCLGALSKGGCGAVCTQGGVPCWGCRGPAGQVLKKMSEGGTFQEVVLNSLKQRSQLDEERVKSALKVLRNQANSALNFDHNLVSDRARLR